MSSNDFIPLISEFCEGSRRPTWHEVWMSFAHIIAQRSHDRRPNGRRVGAIVVTSDNTQLLSSGYNGMESGAPHKPDSLESGESGMIHAELNALIKLDYNNPKSKTMYVTLSPCKQCARIIVNAKINQVIYDEEYRDSSGLILLKNAGVVVESFTKMNCHS